MEEGSPTAGVESHMRGRKPCAYYCSIHIKPTTSLAFSFSPINECVAVKLAMQSNLDYFLDYFTTSSYHTTINRNVCTLTITWDSRFLSPYYSYCVTSLCAPQYSGNYSRTRSTITGCVAPNPPTPASSLVSRSWCGDWELHIPGQPGCVFYQHEGLSLLLPGHTMIYAYLLRSSPYAIRYISATAA